METIEFEINGKRIPVSGRAIADTVPTRKPGLLLSDLKDEYKMQSSGDPWGDLMSAFFAVAESLEFHHEADVPKAWGYHPSPAGRSDDPEEDCWASVCDQADPDALLEFGGMLNRLYGILKAKGLNY